MAVPGPVVVCSCPKEKVVKVLDPETGTSFLTFSDTTVPANGLACVGGAGAIEGLGSAGDYLISSQSSEQALVIHRWGKSQPLFKCRTAEAMGPLTATPDGLFVICGGRSGKAYLWEVASGSMLKSWEAHFKAILCLEVTTDGTHVITSSEDTMVRVWALADLLCGDEHEGVRPVRSLSDHSLPVTGLHCGLGGVTSRLVTCSLDHTVQIYDLLCPASASTAALCSVRCPTGLSCVAADPAEKRLFLGGTGGVIYVVDMDVVSLGRTAAKASLRVAGGKAQGVGAWDEDPLNAMTGHTRAVTAMRCSWDGRLLVSASEDGTLRIWDVNSQQCIKKVSFDNPGPITSLLLLPRPASIRNAVTVKANPAPLQPFKKYKTEQPQQTQRVAGLPAGISARQDDREKRYIASALPPITSGLSTASSMTSIMARHEEVSNAASITIARNTSDSTEATSGVGAAVAGQRESTKADDGIIPFEVPVVSKEKKAKKKRKVTKSGGAAGPMSGGERGNASGQQLDIAEPRAEKKRKSK